MPTLLNDYIAEDGTGVAIVDEAGAVGWRLLGERVNRWIALLRDRGIGEGDRLACVLGNRRETFEVLLACLHSGITVVPINWHLTDPEIAYIVSDSGSKALVVEPSYAETAGRAVARSTGECATLIVTGSADEAGFEAAEPLLARMSSAEPDGQTCGATMLYTSGTTGAPKGVVNGLFVVGAPFSRVAKLTRYAHVVLDVPSRERCLLDGPWYHSSQLFFSLLGLLLGSTLVIRRSFDPESTLDTIDRERITAAHLVPTQFIRLLRLPPEVRARFSGASLGRVWHGGGPCPPDVKRRMIDWWGPVLTEYYGATEGGAVTLTGSRDWLAHPGSVGKAVPPNEIVILGEDGTPQPIGASGQVFVRRVKGQSFRYHNAPEKTRSAHLEPGTFTFGDVGHLDEDGFLYLTGRAQDMIVSGGVNVYPAEIEAVLLNHPVVRDVAVIGVPDDEFGERVAAVVEVTGEAPADLFALLDPFCRKSLAGFKTPRTYHVIERLPREATGKLRKDVLRKSFAVIGIERPDIAHPATFADGVPHAEFARRRETEPVAWTPEPLLTRHSSAGSTTQRGSGYWAVTRYDDVYSVSRRPEEFSSAAKGAFLPDPRTPGDLKQTRQLLVSMDGPEHVRIRRLVATVFTPKSVRGLSDSIAGHARRLVEKVTDGAEFDAVADFAAELPLLVLCDLLGFPPDDRHLLYRWSNALVGFDDPEFGGGDVEAYRRTFAEAFAYAMKLGMSRRETPTDDLISRLVNAEVDGKHLSDREFCSFWLLLVVAGNETTRHLISGSLEALVNNPAERDRLVSGEVPVATAVDELIRWVTPIMQFRRTAVRDTEIAGQSVAEGDKVVVYYTSANRDPAVFTDPDRLDLGRDPNPHLSFGIGPHFCLGAHLARLEMSTLLTELLPQLSRLRLTGPVTRLESNFVNGAKSMPARFVSFG
ncbi:AMP-dependent synthetase [Amycolatopsis sp. WAC 01375]|uniref:cytochrome P450 n=1 Tax=Amycolatopsis sp. WAC 01375 TaxID=2203194 RepID=UPI000F7AADE1|nr:cytochrome P450 [Amycolatopsis sp. WAC 01375]RSM78879.1 AMP-dependent synthetase [Amycolatopsis sp. WAC 01375]